MPRRHYILLAVFAFSPLLFFPFAQRITTTFIGTVAPLLLNQALYVSSILAALLATPFLLVGLLFRQQRRQALIGLVFVFIVIVSTVGGMLIGLKVRMAGMRSFVPRSQPLIAAIKRYETDRAVPPKSLGELVPTYLPAIPSTGMMAYPEYRYYTGQEAKEEYAGNPWVLSVFTGQGLINFDMLLYFPNQNYPARGYGGMLERIGDWAYVNE